MNSIGSLATDAVVGALEMRGIALNKEIQDRIAAAIDANVRSSGLELLSFVMDSANVTLYGRPLSEWKKINEQLTSYFGDFDSNRVFAALEMRNAEIRRLKDRLRKIEEALK